ncbi:MAG: hypothetical protein ACOYYS_27915 [Chloroflexota bacterium]
MVKQRLLVFLVLLLLLGSKPARGSVSAADQPPNRKVEITIPYTEYTWWLLRWSTNEAVCTLTTDHEGLPTEEDVAGECDAETYYLWKNTPACTLDENNPNTDSCLGLYLMLLNSRPAEKTVIVELPPAQVYVSLSGCTPTSLENLCPAIPSLLLTGDEPLPNEQITTIYAAYDGVLYTCQGASCEIPLQPTTLEGSTVEFWADSSFGDTTEHFTALVRVIESGPGGAPVDIAGWYVDVLSDQWRGGQIASCAEVWQAFPPVGGPPSWLTTPQETSLLASDEPYHYLAGRLIAQGAVDAAECASGGMLANGYANACGLEKAWPQVMDWQNQFDHVIITASLQTNIPSQLLKNLFAQESQFWPGVFKDPKEFGLGQITDNGAETVLLWNPAFYNQFCPLVLNETTCEKGYPQLSSEEQATLRGALALQAKSDCAECALGIDLSQSNFSIALFAETLRANCTQVAQIVHNASGKMGGEVSNYEDLWRFTIANYHAGAGCVSYALHQAWNNNQTLDWATASQYFTPPCQGVISYVEKVAR